MKNYLIALFFILANLPAHAVDVGKQAPDFSLPSVTNGTQKIKSTDYKGLVIYIDFWASWCLPCARSFPELNKIYEEFQPYGFEVLAVGIDDNQQDAIRFLNKYPAKFITLHDKNSAVAELYRIPGMPTGYLIGTDGKVKKILVGLSTEKGQLELTDAIRKELGIN